MELDFAEDQDILSVIYEKKTKQKKFILKIKSNFSLPICKC